MSQIHKRTDLTLESKIFSFVHNEIHFDFQTGLRMQKAACVFLHLASTSSSVPPVVVIRLLRYVKVVTCSRTSPPQVMSPVFAWDRILTCLVLDAFTLSPILAACSWSVSITSVPCVRPSDKAKPDHQRSTGLPASGAG